MKLKNGKIQIDRNVPIPKHRGHYPWALMKVGDSFFVEGGMHGIQSQASVRGAKDGRKYATRSENGGVRVWRIE